MRHFKRECPQRWDGLQGKQWARAMVPTSSCGGDNGMAGFVHKIGGIIIRKVIKENKVVVM